MADLNLLPVKKGLTVAVDATPKLAMLVSNFVGKFLQGEVSQPRPPAGRQGLYAQQALNNCCKKVRLSGAVLANDRREVAEAGLVAFPWLLGDPDLRMHPDRTASPHGRDVHRCRFGLKELKIKHSQR